MSGARRTRFAGVGCGRVFQRYHLPCADARDDIELVGAVDLDAGRAEALFADRPGVWTGSSVDRLLKETAPDVISVCTPNDAHEEAVLAALDAGVAVLCEKPLAAGIDAARAIAAHPDADRLLGVNLPYRFHELLKPFTEVARDGTQEIELTFVTPGDRVWRACTPWYGDARRAGGGALLDLGLHALDILVTVFGRPDVHSCEVDSEEVEERARVGLSFQGVPATLRIDRAGRRLAMAVTVRTASGTHVLDFRRGELRLADGTVVEAGGRPELAAISGWFDVVTGTAPSAIATAQEALGLQLLVQAAYERARPVSAAALLG
ncbi:Gfo/Idh/MocA family protein [Streptomyces sp. bgisy100]|uniref:Gfo/Idh/MocA family protein n=1 Tax=Streptomyces sp. bgisy100 TaxID=3413783 RepID=UPI003D733137